MSELTKREKIHNYASFCEQQLGPDFRDIYETTHSLFPVQELETMYIIVQPQSGDFVGGPGTLPNGETVPAMGIGTAPTFASRNLKRRVKNRFGISDAHVNDSMQSDDICRAVAFAHELGHIVQMNESVMRYFGEPLAPAVILPEGDTYTDEEYKVYVESDHEAHADYVAACILAHTPLGERLGLGLPDQYPDEWRLWARAHPVLTA